MRTFYPRASHSVQRCSISCTIIRILRFPFAVYVLIVPLLLPHIRSFVSLSLSSVSGWRFKPKCVPHGILLRSWPAWSRSQYFETRRPKSEISHVSAFCVLAVTLGRTSTTFCASVARIVAGAISRRALSWGQTWEEIQPFNFGGQSLAWWGYRRTLFFV